MKYILFLLMISVSCAGQKVHKKAKPTSYYIGDIQPDSSPYPFTLNLADTSERISSMRIAQKATTLPDNAIICNGWFKDDTSSQKPEPLTNPFNFYFTIDTAGNITVYDTLQTLKYLAKEYNKSINKQRSLYAAEEILRYITTEGQLINKKKYKEAVARYQELKKAELANDGFQIPMTLKTGGKLIYFKKHRRKKPVRKSGLIGLYIRPTFYGDSSNNSIGGGIIVFNRGEYETLDPSIITYREREAAKQYWRNVEVDTIPSNR